MVLSIPEDLLKELGWIKDGLKPIECLVVFGATGGIQISPINGILGQKRLELDREPPPEPNESDADWMHLFRYFSAFPDVTLHVHGNQLRMTIPKEIEEAGILSRAPDTKLVATTSGGVFEVRSIESWNTYNEKTAGSRTQIAQASTDKMARRRESD